MDETALPNNALAADHKKPCPLKSGVYKTGRIKDKC